MRTNTSVCMAVGDNDTEHCGVKDYALRLAEALRQIGLCAEVVAPPDWGVKSFLRFCHELRERRVDIVHLQYPSIGNRHSLGPHLLGLMRVARGVVVTLHEYSALPFMQKYSTHLFRFSSDQLLFTAEAERNRYGYSTVMRRVVHIGSNVPAAVSDGSRTQVVLYFGQIRPNKGLEEFLHLARHSMARGKPYRFQVVGSVPQRRADYFQAIRPTADPRVEWFIDLPAERIGQLMAHALAAYMPFPDGASYRRGSLLAALTNGLPVITRIGQATPHEMAELLLPATEPSAAVDHLDRLCENPDRALSLSLAARKFAERFSWTHIARQHKQIYYETLSGARMSTRDAARPVAYLDPEN